MASRDPSTYQSSEEIFSSTLTLPQIRSLHKSLHLQIDEKSSRLRSQVGGSYRELLGTADAIVRMRQDNDEVQHVLATMGGRCGRTVVTSKAANLSKFVYKQESPFASVATRLRLLEACALVSERILKGGSGPGDGATRGDRLILAAKILALSRLVIKSFGDGAADADAQAAADALKKTLDTLRRRLRRRVEKTLEKPGDDSHRPDILKALCVPSLTSSSGAKDALRFFLEARKNAMTRAFDIADGERLRTLENVVHALRVYTRTLLDVQALLPTKLPEALSDLKKHPLVQDSALQRIENLRLDVYGRWCTEELQYFTPFIRHDDLDGKQAREMLASWAEHGSQCLLDGLKQTLEEMTDYKHIMELRTKVLQLWIRDGGKARGFDPQEMQDDLRQVINARMHAVLESKVSKLRIVGSEVTATLQGWEVGVTDKQPELWDQPGYDDALAIGAAPFLQEVASRLYGRNNAVSKAVHSYMSWYKVIDDITDVVDALKKQRWDNDYDEVEDEETIEARQQVLGKKDPKQLQDKLDAALDKTYKELEAHLTELWEKERHQKHGGGIAAYFLRIIRDIRSKLPDRAAVQRFGLDMVPSLHDRVAQDVADAAIKEFAVSGLSVRVVTGKSLWEGDPSIPNQPSPELFNFLHNLSTTMSELGIDLWTPGAVKALKQRLGTGLRAAWAKELESLTAKGSTDVESNKKSSKKKKRMGNTSLDEADETEKVETASEKSAEERVGDDEEKSRHYEKGDPELVKDICTQWLFDISVLQNCMGSGGTAKEELLRVAEQVFKLTGIEDESARKGIVKQAGEFWQRISLLFALLA
ncbi:Vps51/Vps67-like protein [Cordyceps fumosorosea ARSEF 2679]|uniref:Conserved oligomeric Golgi complex subunit 1 n=1 Tax=Cordyceps fumosorosea (strain ARSEF 2679) TaxID=1081104 RepID=A0A168CEG8_CORFA|nr:Vps51/Vps67-like protein [Cordyceps fumosorosea ARSEF 2679]OAA71280.1 Vps51/Vps67-like protein [Cordyceps fumosorosea ARSEF 2679]